VSPAYTRPVQRARWRAIPPKPVSNTARPPTSHRRRPHNAIPHLVHDALEAQHFRSVKVERIRLPVHVTRAGREAAGGEPRRDRCHSEHIRAWATGAGIAGQAGREYVGSWAAGAGFAEESVIRVAGRGEGGIGAERWLGLLCGRGLDGYRWDG
jgi:hypothetical protein